MISLCLPEFLNFLPSTKKRLFVYAEPWLLGLSSSARSAICRKSLRCPYPCSQDHPPITAIQGRLIPSLRPQTLSQSTQALPSAPSKIKRVRSATQLANGRARSTANDTVPAQQKFVNGGPATSSGNNLRQSAPRINGVNGVNRVNGVNNNIQRVQLSRDKPVRRDSVLSTFTTSTRSSKGRVNGVQHFSQSTPTAKTSPETKPSINGRSSNGVNGVKSSSSAGSVSGRETSITKKKNPPKLRRRTETEASP